MVAEDQYAPGTAVVLDSAVWGSVSRRWGCLYGLPGVRVECCPGILKLLYEEELIGYAVALELELLLHVQEDLLLSCHALSERWDDCWCFRRYYLSCCWCALFVLCHVLPHFLE